jgi:site-specific recombinase XerD
MSVPRVNLFRRSNGIFYVGIRIDNRRVWRSTGRTTRREAISRLGELHELFHPKISRRTLSQFLAEYRSYAEPRLAAGTLAIYLDSLRRFQCLIGDIPLAEVNARQADMYISKRAAEVRPATVNIELRSLRAAFSVAKRWASEYVFQRNGSPIGASYLTHLFKRYVRRAGLPWGTHLHSLRHTFASWLAQDAA